jgi:hypothetical protein
MEAEGEIHVLSGSVSPWSPWRVFFSACSFYPLSPLFDPDADFHAPPFAFPFSAFQYFSVSLQLSPFRISSVAESLFAFIRVIRGSPFRLFP